MTMNKKGLETHLHLKSLVFFFYYNDDGWEGFVVWAAGDADVSSPTVRFSLFLLTFLNSTFLLLDYMYKQTNERTTTYYPDNNEQGTPDIFVSRVPNIYFFLTLSSTAEQPQRRRWATAFFLKKIYLLF